MKKTFSVLVFLGMAGLIIWSCKHGDLPEPDVDLSLEQDYVTMLSDLNSIQATVDSAVSVNANSMIPWGIKTFNANYKGYTKFTIDFTAQPFPDSLTRTGQIEVYQSGGYLQRTLRDSIVYVNFFIGGRSISGHRVIISPLPDSTPGVRKLVIYDSAAVEFPLGNRYILETTPLYRIVNSNSKTTTIYGSSNGIANTKKFSVSIAAPSTIVSTTHLNSSPLIYDLTCSNTKKSRYPVSGALSFKNQDRNILRTINFEKGVQLNLPEDKSVTWLSKACNRNIATFVSPLGNVYYFDVK